MGLFDKKHDTLSHAILAGDIRAVRKMLERGADPNRCDPNDDAFPLHYALNHGPEIVQLLIDHGADVNIPCERNKAMPLALAESRGYAEVAAILRRAGARLRTGKEELGLDPRERLKLEPKIAEIHFLAKSRFPGTDPEVTATYMEEQLKLSFPSELAEEERESIRRDVRALIRKECGVKDYLKGTDRPVPTPEEAMAQTGLSEHELTRRFLEHLIKEGKDPFAGIPEHFLRQAERDFPDLLDLARRKFGRRS